MNMKTSRPIFYILYQNPKASLAGLVIMLEYINFAFILYTVERLTSIALVISTPWTLISQIFPTVSTFH
ncbi:hypothetical protein AAZX31_02G076200 [Glycine max]